MTEKQQKYYAAFNDRLKEWEMYIKKTIEDSKKNDTISDEICINAAKHIVTSYDQTEIDLPTSRYFHILQSFVISFHNYMVFNIYPKKIEDTYKLVLLKLLNTAIAKFDNILILYETNRYEDCLYLYRKYFENLIILNILKNNKGCIIPFQDFASYNISTEGLIVTEKELMRKRTYGDLLNNDYGWAYSIFLKNDIALDDLIFKVCRKEIFIEQLLKFTTASQHSYTSTVLSPIFNEVVESLLNINIIQMGIPLLIRSIYDIHYDMCNISCEMFLGILYKIMPDSPNNLKRWIEKINTVDYIYKWPSDEENIRWRN
jgi:hypothetical protein